MHHIIGQLHRKRRGGSQPEISYAGYLLTHPRKLVKKKKCGGPRSGPKLILIGTKTVVLITEIKTQEYHVNLHLLLIFFDKQGLALGGQ